MPLYIRLRLTAAKGRLALKVIAQAANETHHLPCLHATDELVEHVLNPYMIYCNTVLMLVRLEAQVCSLETLSGRVALLPHFVSHAAHGSFLLYQWL